MKKLIIVLLMSVSYFQLQSQTITKFYSPTGTDGSGWSYVDYVIPIGMKIDSIYGGFRRPGYPVKDEIYEVEYCSNTSVYNSGSYTPAWNWSTTNFSYYNYWINITANNFIDVGMTRISIPTNAGAIWDSLLIATSFLNDTCFTIPDGTDGSGWSYKDYVIPTGYKLDSVYMDATRTGYPASACDWELEYCAGTSTYNSGSYVSAWNFGAINTSLYGMWINITSNNFTDVGMVRASLPTNSGAVWNQLCIAISLINTTGIKEDRKEEINIYPSPSSGVFTVRAKSDTQMSIYDITGQKVYDGNLKSGCTQINLSERANGIYFIHVMGEKGSVYEKIVLDK